MQVGRRYERVGSTRIYYQVTGTGPPVVLIHGFSGSSRWWVKNVPALAQHFRVYMVDLLGFGHSKTHHRFVLQEASWYLTRWMDRLKVPAAHLVGHSMGGVISIELAAEFPQRVNRLVLVGPAVINLQGGLWRQIAGLLQAFWLLPYGFLPVLFTDALRAGPRVLLQAAYELLTVELDVDIGQVKTPTLLVWGENDKAVPLKVGKAILQQLPQGKLKVIPGAGHTPMWDQPELFNTVVTDFLLSKRST